MTSDLDNPSPSDGDRARARSYALDFWPGIVGYCLVLGAVLTWGHLDGSSPWRFVWAAAPVLPALWVLRAVVRHFARVDDYQRRLLLQSLGIGFAAAMIAAVTVGFLDIAGLPLHGMASWIIYVVGMSAWLVESIRTGDLVPLGRASRR